MSRRVQLTASDVHSHATVDTRAADAHEATEVSGRPSRVCSALQGMVSDVAVLESTQYPTIAFAIGAKL